MGFLRRPERLLQRTTRRLGSQATARKRFQKQLRIEQLEDRRLPAGVVPNDPGFVQQWELNNTGQTGGQYDADLDAPEAWSITTGSMATVVAVLDMGVDYADPDLYLNIWLNQGEIPPSVAASLTDSDGDELITFRDLNHATNASFVTDLNANGYIDGGDLLRDFRWANGIDEDGNGKVDDLVGWDFHDNDNDPKPEVSGGVYQTHGTDMAKIIGAMTNNGVGTAGINWKVRLVPERIRSIGGSTTDLLNSNAAAALDYAVALGAPISNNSWRAEGGGYSFSLNSSNTNPKGIVTDGTYLWVVNDSSTDKVFKYQISTNALVSSWTITGGGGSPTGITLDPSNASMDMWIVDSSSDKVYRLANARTTVATSVAATSPFSLAAGNTNPQGIADPPPAGTQLPPAPAGLTPAPLSLAPDFEESNPPATAFAAANLRTSDSRRDERVARVDQALVLPGSTKLPLRDSSHSIVVPVQSERTVRTSDDDARDIFDEALLVVLAETDLSPFASGR